MKTYHIINTECRDSVSELKHYTFEQLKAQFEPDASIKEDEPEVWQEWQNIKDLYDLEQFLEHQAAGMVQPYKFTEDERGAELERATKGKYTACELNAMIELVNSLDEDTSDILILSELNSDYISINCGRDGNVYAWYVDERRNKAIRVDNLTAINDADIEKILM